MSFFATINHISEFEDILKNKKELRITQQKNGTQVICYMISDNNTFDSKLAIECRGITFDKDGYIICRPLHKFFNVNENEHTQLESINWQELWKLMEKLDGSMLTPVKVNNKIHWKTKKSFTSDVAIAAQKYADTQATNLNNFAQEIADNYTAIFEYMSPKARIVVGYPKETMTLLHIRHIKTGEYMDLKSAKWLQIIHKHNIQVVSDEITPLTELINKTKTFKGYEGHVAQFNNGDMMKFKTEWYMKLHHVVTFLRERDIAELALNEQLDDVKAAMIEAGHDIIEVNRIEKKLKDRIISIESEITGLYETIKHLERKEIAILHNQNQFFKLLMDLVSGKELNIKEFYAKKLLKLEYTLETLHSDDDEAISMIAKSHQKEIK